MRFLGNSEAKTDAKGRVFLPAVFRKQLQAASQECLILRKDTYQDCLVLYPENVWNEQMNELRCKLNRWNSKRQRQMCIRDRDDTIEIWSKEIADKPFITPEDFGKELEEIMGTNNNVEIE